MPSMNPQPPPIPPIIFLDIDGVLNGHNFCHLAKSCLIKPECVTRFNRVLHVTGAKVVLSSAWRYMIHGGSQTTKGFEYMLRTHGVSETLEIVGVTCTDETPGFPTRGSQIRKWLDDNGPVESYVVVDDDSYDIADDGHPLVKTDGKIGLTDEDVERIIELLN